MGIRRRRRDDAVIALGPKFEQDDGDIWQSVQDAMRGPIGRQGRFNYQMGLGGMGEAKPIEDWPGPGVAVASSAGEGGLRTFHETWYERMTGRKVSAGGH